MFSWQSVDEAGRLRLKSNDFRDAQPLPRLRAFYLLSYLPASPDHLSIGFRPTWTGRFNSVNCCRDSFHRVALATLEHAVLESSDAGSIRWKSMRSRQVGQRGRSVGDSCGNPLRMDALRVSYVYTNISKMTLASIRCPTGTPISAIAFHLLWLAAHVAASTYVNG
jgi:hypothetical protein